MPLGVDALTRFQSGTEATPGTPVAATRIDYIEPGAYFKDELEFVKPKEARNSYARNYRSFASKRHAALSGLKFPVTFETLPRYLQGAAKGGVTYDVIGGSKALQTSAAADDIIDCTAHGFAIGDAVVFTSLTGGTGLSVNTVYYVIAANFAANTFQISATPGGAAFNFSADITAGAVQKAGDGGVPPLMTYTFKRTVTSNDLKHFTWEVGNNVQEWQLAGMVCDKLEIGWAAGGAMDGSMDWLGLTSAKSTFTGALADTVPEDVVPSLSVVYLDDTTIGSTLYAYPMSAKFSHSNGWQQLWVLNNALTPKENYRPEAGKADLELKIAFDGTAEYDKFVAHQIRKIRVLSNGSIIHDAVTKSLQLDWYGKWDAYDMGSDGGLHVATIKGESFYDTTLGSDWQIVVKNSLLTLP